MSAPDRDPTPGSIPGQTLPDPGSDAKAESAFLLSAYTRLLAAVTQHSSTLPVLPTTTTLTQTLSSLPTPPFNLPTSNQEEALTHLLDSILPSLNQQSLSSYYYGFVTGSSLPIAQFADNLVTALDQNVQVHFPLSPSSSSSSPSPWNHTSATYIESTTLSMLLSLLSLPPSDFPAKTFTTGATASNILGLACGREYIITSRLPPQSSHITVAKAGLIKACIAAGVQDIKILTSAPHSSLLKAAKILGLGQESVVDVGQQNDGKPWRVDLDKLEYALQEAEKNRTACIIAISCGEVNTGRFATGVFDMPKIRSLADRYKAWVHVDGAFGIFARALPKTDEFLSLHACVAGMELADSIGADGHKLLNVPYDNGIFLSRHPSTLTQVFSNPGAAYLAPSSSSSTTNSPSQDEILSPLNIGLENSRRFRALPVYAVLKSEGRDGMAAMFSRMVLLARKIASFVHHSEHYELLPETDNYVEEDVFIIVLFRAKNEALNEVLVDRINQMGKMFVSGTQWQGKKAVRIAVSTWRVQVERDAKYVEGVLKEVAESFADA
ncbi:pyridoxal phosphate-dependent transferase [Apiosordaria backusii]|uniref:Pyridoxal phosphate-dependent transferase n=1 Tax=Apiosordaria backusii TaxID=314023 RepID=A0AA40ETD0_9PEZI|nr:pyridoxal phosphate-dependent transferase [Apiosordaria backusii]